MRRVAVFVLVLAAFAAVVGGASGTSDKARAGSPITIGYVIGLTGGASSFDLPTLQGAKVAIADINAAGGVAGHPLKLITVDTQSKFTNGTSGAQQAIEKGAKIIVPSCDYDYGGPAARQGNKQGVLVIACAGDPLMGRTGTGPLTFNIFPPAPAEGADEAQFAIKKGWKNAYELVDTSIQYSKRGCQYMEQAYTHLGGKIVGKDSFLNSDPSIAPQVSRMRNEQSKAQVLLLCSYVPGVSTAIKQIRAGGINLPIVAQIGVDGRFILKSIPDLTKLYYGSVGLIFGEDHAPPTLATLGKQFLAKGGSKSTTEWAVVAGYSEIQMIRYALTQSKGSTNAKVLQGILQKARNVPILTGAVTYSAKCHTPIKAAVKLAQVQDGKLSVSGVVKPIWVPPYPC
jgi:branched-chain amino acid transport system substrate-binding protein